VNRFDSLVHVTRDGRWLNGRADAGAARLASELDRGRIDRACLVGLPGVVDNAYILECARADARLVPIAGVTPGDFDAAALARAGFAGIKLHPRLGGYDPLADSTLAAVKAAAEARLVVFIDTLFRQRARATTNAADTIDRIAQACGGATIVLLHGGGPALLHVAEVVRLHATLVLDLSFTILQYAGTSLEPDLRWVMERLDQRVVIGSDMPEHTPDEAFGRAERLASGFPSEKWANISHRNLQRLFPASAS